MKTMSRAINLTNQKFGRWTVLRQTHDPKLPTGTYWLCRCDCGIERPVASHHLRLGKTNSCGCLRTEQITKSDANHKHPLYATWLGIKTRCFSSQHPTYRNYGARGISMHPAWRDSFEEFLKGVGDRPSKHHSLDRIDNNGNYEPRNIRWATAKEQAQNKRPYTPRKTDLTGEVFGKLTVLAENRDFKPKPNSPRHPLRYWCCQCECGRIEPAIHYEKLMKGIATSCGCDKIAEQNPLSTTNENYLYYFWRRNRGNIATEFKEFVSHVGRRPSPKHVLHRDDKTGTYAWHQLKDRKRARDYDYTPMPTTETHPDWISINGHPPAPLDFYLCTAPKRELPDYLTFEGEHLTPAQLASTTFTDPAILTYVLTHMTFPLTTQEAVELATKLEMAGYKIPA